MARGFLNMKDLTSCSWNHWTVTLGLPAPSPNLTLIQPQKSILRPTASLMWSNCGGRSPHIIPTYTLIGHKLLVDDHHYKMSGWVQSLSSQQCQLGPIWECGPWKTSVLMHFLPFHLGPWEEILHVLEASEMCGSFIITHSTFCIRTKGTRGHILS